MKSRSVTVDMGALTISEKQVCEIASEHYGSARVSADVNDALVVDFTDFVHASTETPVYASFCSMSFQRAMLAFLRP